MLLEFSSTLASSAPASFDTTLSFSDLSRELHTPSAWQFQLGYLLNSELDLPAGIHMLDRAVGLGTLLDLVRVQVLDSTVWVHCGFVGGAVVEWCSPSDSFVASLEAIAKDIEAMKAEENKFKSAVELEEGQRRRTRHQHTQSLEPATLGRKPWAHKRQKSFLHTIVSAVGSMMSPRSSSPSNARAVSRNDFPVSPSPSPPLSSDSRGNTPSPDSSLTNHHGHGHPPHTYTYGIQHKIPHPVIPWSPPRTPLSPSLPQSPNTRSYHQARMQEYHRRISAQLVDVYRRFVLEALVFAFAKDVGLVSEALPAPPGPYAGPVRSSVNVPTVYNYRLWLLRSMVRSAENEMGMIEESCRALVKEDFERAQAQDLEDEMDISDGNISVDITPRSAMDQGRRSCGTSVLSPPTSPTIASKQKVSFDSFASGASPTKTSGEHELTKKKSRGKLVKKRSFAALLGDKGDKDAPKEKEKEKGDAQSTQRNILGLKRSWGRSKSNMASVPAPLVIPPLPSELPAIEGGADPAPLGGLGASPMEEVEDAFEAATQDSAHLTVPSDVGSGQGSKSLYASRRESSSTTESTSSGSMATIESGVSAASDDTDLTTPTTSDVELPKVDEEVTDLPSEQEEQDIGVDSIEPPPRPYSNKSASKSTLNILDQLNPTCTASSSSLLIPLTNTPNCTPTTSATARRSTNATPDVDSPDFQLTLQMRLKLNPEYTRLSQRASKLREMISAAETERRDILEEEGRYLDILEVRSQRRAWSNGVLGRCNTAAGRSGVPGDRHINSDLARLGLSAPFRSSGLASSAGMWTNEDAENEGWEYVNPPLPHPLFHGGGVVMSMAFPTIEFGDPPDVSPRLRMMRKADLKMRLQMEREKRREAAMDCDGAFGGGMRIVDDREDGMEVVGGVFEPVLDSRWDAETLLDPDHDDEMADHLEMDIDDDVFGSRRQKDFHDLANIPPRPRMTPAKVHPPPARLFAVVEEEESDELDDTPNSGGTGTETETETEGEGDEFEFDNVDMSRRSILRNEALSDESEDDDEAFFADIHDITDIVGDIEDGLERHRRHPHRRRRRHPTQRNPPKASEFYQSRQARSHPSDQLEALAFSSPAYPYDSFDVDVDMGMGGGAPRNSSLEFEVESTARAPGKPVRHRIKTPYPEDIADTLANDDSGIDDEGFKPKGKTSKKRPRNHRRQWQSMLTPGSYKNEVQDEDISGGIEITLEAERPKPRFMPAIKAIMGKGLKTRRSVEPSAELPKEPIAGSSSEPTMHHSGTPRARTTSMYHRQPSPHSRAALSSPSNSTTEKAKVSGMGLPLDVGYGYGTYSNTPPPRSPSDKPLSESSLLCQPVRFSSPSASSPSWDTPAVSRPRLATKSLVASPPVFSAPAPSANPTRPRKHIRSVHLNLDLEDATVEHFELAGYGQFGPRSPTSPSSSQWSACSHSPGECDSNCSSASLPMSPTPLSPPSPVIGIAASFAPLVPGSPAIRAMEKPDGGVEGAWQDDVEELNLDAPCPSDKPQFHLPFSLPVASKGNHPLDPTTNEDTLVDVDMKVVKGDRKPKAVPERKSVLADPAFFEPPVMVKEDVSVETKLVACR